MFLSTNPYLPTFFSPFIVKSRSKIVRGESWGVCLGSKYCGKEGGRKEGIKVACLRCTNFGWADVWVGKHVIIVLKPSNVTIQGQLNPRKSAKHWTTIIPGRLFLKTFFYFFSGSNLVSRVSVDCGAVHCSREHAVCSCMYV